MYSWRLGAVLAAAVSLCLSHSDDDIFDGFPIDVFAHLTGMNSSDPEFGAHVRAKFPSLDHSHDDFDSRLADAPCVWTAWSHCSATCDGGLKFIIRRLGKECEHEQQIIHAPCNTKPCPQHCQLGVWEEWGGGCCECNKPCGGGQRSRTRPVLQPQLFGGNECHSTVETESCNTHPCPTDCVVKGVWGHWSGCDKTCDGGRRERRRETESVPVERSGPSQTAADCPESLQEEACNSQPCPIDCRVSAVWSDWSQCSASCGEGQQTRSRSIVEFPQNGGQACDTTMEIRSCLEGGIVLPPCPSAFPVRDTQRVNQGRPFPSKPIIIRPAKARRLFNPSTTTTTTTTTTTPPNVDQRLCLGRPDGPVERPGCRGCCKDLIMCYNEAGFLKWCPTGKVFSDRFKRCVSSAESGC